MRDRWLAANLSLAFAGLGQVYVGCRIAGGLLLAVEIGWWATFLAWLLVPGVSTWVLLGGLALIALVRLGSAVHACRSVPPAAPGKNPWLSFFLTRFIPGLGHAYAGRWIRAVLFLALTVAAFFWEPGERWVLFVAVAWILFHTAVLFDSYFVLRRSNLVGARATAWTLVFLLLTTQTYLMALAVKAFVAEVYKIPSSAMEPTLMGDSHEEHRDCPFEDEHRKSAAGDRIVVSKLGYAFAPVERFDVAVFIFPLNQAKAFVKRVVGMPGEEMMIRDGDIWVKGKGGAKFGIARKPAGLQDRLWIRVAEAPGMKEFLEQWDPMGGARAGTEGVEGSFFFREGIGEAYGGSVGDVQVAFEVLVDGPGVTVGALIEGGAPAFTARAGGGYRLEVKEEGGSRSSGAPAGLDVTPGEWHAFDLSIWDGLALLRFDGKTIAQDEFLREPGRGREERRRVTIQVEGGRARLRHVRVSRDLHYVGKGNLPEGQPVAVPEGNYVFLGDNVANSHDARSWTRCGYVFRDGRTIVYEEQEGRHDSDAARRLMEERKLAAMPDRVVRADASGHEVPIYEAEIVDRLPEQPFLFVERRFIVGRVLKVWWPLTRARPVR